MCEGVFQILRVGKSLELIMASFQLLNELDKVLHWSLYFNSIYNYILRCHIILTCATLVLTSFKMQRYPRVYLSNSDKSKSSSNAPLELVVVKEVVDSL